MFTEIERSRVHLALTRAVDSLDYSETDTDRRKAGMALAIARYGGRPELAQILAAADAIEDLTCGCAGTFNLSNVIPVTGLDRAACEVVMMLIGARQRGPLTWDVDHGEQVTLPQDLMQKWAKYIFPKAA